MKKKSSPDTKAAAEKNKKPLSSDKGSRKEVKEQRDLLRNLIQEIPDILFLKDPAGRYLMVNKAFLKNVSWKKREIIGKKDSDLLPAAQARRYHRIDQAAIKNSRPVHSEDWFVVPSGEKRYFHTVKTLIRDSEGRKIGLLGISRDVTEAREAEIARAESEKQYRVLSENSLTGIFILSAEEKVIYCNQTLVKLSGYDEKELKGKAFLNFIYHEDRDMVRENFLRRMKGLPTSEHYVCRALRKDGSIAWIEIRATLITWRGKPAVLGNFFDITERKRYEEELLRHDLVYRSMQEAVIISMDDGKIVDVNPAAEKLFGWNRKELVGKTAELFTPPDQAKKIGNDISRSLRQRGIWRGELPVITKLGECRTFSAVITTLRDKSGEWLGRVCINRDITEWKKQAVALKESEERYRSTIDSMGDPIHVIDRDFRLLLFNQAFRDWHKELGLKIDVIGKSLFKVFPFLPAKVKTEYRQVFKSGQVLVSEERTNIGGREIFTETRKIPVREGEKVNRVITVLRNVTERKQAESRLREASKLEGVGTICLGFSHEFNNILMGISGYSQLAQADPDDRRIILKALEVISRQTERGKELIQRLSSFGQRAKPSLKPVAICRVLDEVIALQELELKNAGIRVKKRYESRSPALVDYSQMLQVFFNLIRNSRQALQSKKQGTITLQVREKGRMLEIIVRDNGIGIPSEELPRIFLPFFTTKGRSEEAQIPSLGLGLWVSRQIVEEMGGTIEVKSCTGQGTKFTIQVPRAGAKSKKLLRKTARRKRPEAVVGDGKKLLFVDDEEDLLAVYGDYFRKRSFEIALAASSAEAIRLSGKQGFDFILLDYVMPGISGKRLARKIKEANPESRVLVITGQTVPPEEKQALKPYVYRWLKKPLNLQKILDVVGK